MWRTTGDIYAQFDGTHSQGSWTANGVMHCADLNEPLRRYAGNDHWNDPDMLEVGNGGFTDGENRAHFSIWCMMAAPLIAGNDITKMNASAKAILTDKEAIAIDQDTMGVQGFRYTKKDSLETWIKPLGNGDWAVCFLNRNDKPMPVNFDWKKEMIEDTVSHNKMNGVVYKIRDVWMKKAAGNTGKPFTTTVSPHDVVLLRLSK